jgi:hypothetical protein
VAAFKAALDQSKNSQKMCFPKRCSLIPPRQNVWTRRSSFFMFKQGGGREDALIKAKTIKKAQAIEKKVRRAFKIEYGQLSKRP